MKKILSFLFIAMLALNVYSVKAASPSKTGNSVSVNAKSADDLVKRVYQIRDMNRSALSASERQDLRNELQSIKSRLSEPDFTGLYLSSGVIIIILIVLLILALR